MSVPANISAVAEENIHAKTQWPQDMESVYKEKAEIYWRVIEEEPREVAIQLMEIMQRQGVGTTEPLLNTIVPSNLVERHKQSLSGRREVKAVA